MHAAPPLGSASAPFAGRHSNLPWTRFVRRITLIVVEGKVVDVDLGRANGEPSLNVGR